MSTDNFTQNRAGLLKSKKDKLLLWRQAKEEAHYWGALCHNAAELAKICEGNTETATYLEKVSARCGKKAAEANQRKIALDKELSVINANITLSDAGMTWREMRDEQAANDDNH